MQIVNGNGFLIQTATTIEKRFLSWNCRFPVYIKSFVWIWTISLFYLRMYTFVVFYGFVNLSVVKLKLDFFINTLNLFILLFCYFFYVFVFVFVLHHHQLFAVTKWSILKTCKLLNDLNPIRNYSQESKKESVVSIKLFWQKTKCHAKRK